MTAVAQEVFKLSDEDNGPCFLCGDESAVFENFGAIIPVPPELAYLNPLNLDIPCGFIESVALSGALTPEQCALAIEKAELTEMYVRQQSRVCCLMQV